MDRAALVTVLQNGRDFEDLKTALFLALAEHCRASRFFPMLADIVTRIEGNIEDRAALAWSLVRKAVRKYGSGRSIRFSNDPVIHYAIEKMGGWWHLDRVLDNENEPWKFKEFARFYRLGEKRVSWNGENGTIAVIPYFPSEHEVNNRWRGFELPRKVYDVETGELVSDSLLPAIGAPRTQGTGIVQTLTDKMRTRFLTA